jgi:hypothetical protein
MGVGYVEVITRVPDPVISIPDGVEMIHSSLVVVSGAIREEFELKRYHLNDTLLSLIFQICNQCPNKTIERLGNAIANPDSFLHTLSDIKRTFRGARMHVLRPARQILRSLNTLKSPSNRGAASPKINAEEAIISKKFVVGDDPQFHAKTKSLGMVSFLEVSVLNSYDPFPAVSRSDRGQESPVFVESYPLDLSNVCTELIHIPRLNSIATRIVYNEIYIPPTRTGDIACQINPEILITDSKPKLTVSAASHIQIWSTPDLQGNFELRPTASSDRSISPEPMSRVTLLSPPPRMIRKKGTNLWEDDD